ncbi:protein of unknown function [Alcaligenes faecalis subsp. faecalis]|nr:protein of unknown function [Alcaligenes faecalis subsp. faecalis]
MALRHTYTNSETFFTYNDLGAFHPSFGLISIFFEH